MSTIDIKDKFSEAEKEVDDAHCPSTGDYRLSTAIFQGLKLIALAIIYHANNK